MTTDANMDQPDVVIVGGVNSSADFIPDLCNALSNRVRGVVFIDHDIEEIRELKTKLQSAGIEMASITLQKQLLERERFDELTEELDMRDNAAWSDPLPNHPPAIRLHVKLRSKEIFDAAWGFLPTIGGRLVPPRAKIVFAFGITGMTSSTVAIESGSVIRETLRNHMLNIQSNFSTPPDSRDNESVTQSPLPAPQSTIDQEAPRHIGIGLFPPDPSEGAGEYNLLHGLNASHVLTRKLPLPEDRPEDVEEKNLPFDRFFFIDASGFSRTQDLQAFDEWSSRTVYTLLTCNTITDQSFFGANELLNDSLPYSNAALILMGGTLDEQEAMKWFLMIIIPRLVMH